MKEVEVKVSVDELRRAMVGELNRDEQDELVGRMLAAEYEVKGDRVNALKGALRRVAKQADGLHVGFIRLDDYISYLTSKLRLVQEIATKALEREEGQSDASGE